MEQKLKLYKKSLKNKKVTVIGIGVSNVPLIKFLCTNGAIVTACDKRHKEELQNEIDALNGYDITYNFGENYLDELSGEVIFKTPGMRFDIKPLVEARNNGSIVTSEMEVFFALCPCRIIAVTGSDGKTTTTTLVSEILKKQGYKVWLGGNIGNPLIGEIENINENDIAVLELSSFQLHTMKASANVSVVTNLSPNHLDMHKSMDEYIDAKKNIYRYQSNDDKLIVNFDNEITFNMASQANGSVTMFSRNTPLDKGICIRDGFICKDGKKFLDISCIRIPGMHNVENYMAAIAATDGLADVDTVKWVAKNFGGVEHRIEFVREVNGVKYYNDSIASSPTRAIAGLHSFDKKIIIIAGGYDKNIPFDDFGYELKDHVKMLFLMGDTAPKIKAAAENAGMNDVVMCSDMRDAVNKAYAYAKAGDIVMLSPACASFDMFKNFMVRGIAFKEAVNELKGE